MVPAAKLFDGDAEAVGDGDERIAAAHGVALRVRAGGGGDRDDEFVTFVERFAGGNAVGFRDIG